MAKKRTRRDTSLNVWPSFTDLITSIFIFAMFLLILMVVQNFISLVQLRKLHHIVGSIFKDLDELKEAMKEEEVEVEKGTIVIKSDVLFPFNRWEIRDDQTENLKRIGENLKTYLDSPRRQKFRIVIEGHTDTMGPAENNDRLSYQRAQSLALLWRDIGFTPEYYELIPAGLGESNPKIEVKRDTITIYSDVFSPAGMWDDGDSIRPSAQEDLKSIGDKLKNALEARRRDGKFAISIKARTDTQRVSDLSAARISSLVMLWRNIGLTQHEDYELISRAREGDGRLATKGTEGTEGAEGTKGTEGTKGGVGSFRIAAIDSNLRKAVENANRRVEVKIIPKFSELEPFYRSRTKKPTDS